jgi:Flp pilus assembly protein TadG
LKAVKGQSGQATVLVLGLSLFAFAVAGLAVDGTRAFLYRRTLQNAADAAALAGAADLDVEKLYTGGSAAVDPTTAERTAGEWLTKRQLAVDAEILATTSGVRVVLHGEVTTTFLGAVGIDELPVEAHAHAEPLEAGPGGE